MSIFTTENKRNRVRWLKGTVLWKVPIRFWEECTPERCVVERDDSKHDYEGQFSTLAFHDAYGHDVYLDPDDLFPTIEECNAEIARRRDAKNDENSRDVERMMAALEAKRQAGVPMMKALRETMQAGWAEGDKRDPGRFSRPKK